MIKRLRQRFLILGAFFICSAGMMAQQKKPNILIIWGDDIGQFRTSALTTWAC